ncbi:unnamed protein product [Nippostrongylus brasiliensis]|uniref:Protein quiver n=1 Tax=Nippostrongylus brasiliensis TaxID=27835 RepID=A0A0N4XTI3_NIPBR|nr:hypothetical protein Q1695_000908 [Nippostrongylus brasiliensis]VDL69505.1 unnamed protein product [Nippostrongylus brasiliensis]
MRHAASAATRSAFLLCWLLSFTPIITSLRCHLYHEIWEDGRKLQITPDICSSNRYCVSAFYRDPNPTRKNGHSVGCDRVDCDQSDDPEVTEWRSTTDGRRCRKHRDYGRHGEICCCKTDLCNSATASTTTLVVSRTFCSLFVLAVLSPLFLL